MSINNNNQALSEITLFHPLLEIWSSSVTFDLRGINGITKLPPKQLVTNGRMFLIPQGKLPSGKANLLSQLTSVRKGVERTLSGVGIRLMGGYAIPNSKVSAVLQEIADYNAEFDRLVSELVANVADLYNQQINHYPEWASQLIDAQISPSSIQKRCRFDMAVFEVSAPKNVEAARRFSGATNGIFDQVLGDLADNAHQILRNTFTNRGNGITRKALRPVNRIIEKLDTFTFVDARLVPMVTYLQETMNSLPLTGNLSTNDIGRVVAMLTTITSPDDFIAFGTGSNTNAVVQPSLSDFEFEDADEIEYNVPKTARVQPDCSHIV